MKRTKIKGTSAQQKTGSSQSDPDFFGMPFLPEIPTAPKAGAAPSPASLLRKEFPPLSDYARMSSLRPPIPTAIPTPASVAAFTSQLIIHRAMMLEASPSLSMVQSVWNQRPASMPFVSQTIPFDSRFLLDGRDATGSNALWPVPATGPLLLAPVSSLFPVPAPPKQVDAGIFALLRELSDRRWDL